MRRRIEPGAWLGLLLTGMAILPDASRVRAGEPEVNPLTADERAAMAVFDELGVRSPAELPYVRLLDQLRTPTEVVGKVSDAKGWDPAWRGFLVARTHDSVTLLHDGWFERRYLNRDRSPRSRWTVETLDLGLEVDRQIARDRESAPDAEKDPEAAQRARMEAFLQAQARRGWPALATRVALARACTFAGDRARAHQLLAATPWREALVASRADGLRRTLRERLLHALHEPWMSKAVWTIADRTLPWESALPALQAHRRTWPDSPHSAAVEELMNALGQAAKDEARHEAEAKPTAGMTRAEQIRELVFLLRDQNGVMAIGHHWPSLWADDRWEESPAARLARFGHEAVPALLHAMGDRTLTRTVGEPPYVIRVGDVAAAVLGRIAGREFGEAHTLAVGRTGGRARDLSEALAWWAELSTGVERQRLNSVVATGGESALEHARRLLAVYPEDVPGSVSIALRASSDAGIRRSLVELLCRELPGDAQRDVLLGLLRQADDLRIRIQSAEWLHAHGDPAALTEALRIWASPELKASSPDRDVAPSELVRFLVRSRSLEAQRALVEGIRGRPRALRVEMVRTLEDILGRTASEPLAPLLRTAWEKYLLTSLDDEPIVDRAAVLLFGLLDEDVPEPAAPRGSIEAREQIVAAVRQAWTRKRGVPLPSGPR